MGTPEWAIPSLEAVLECGTEISAVFTQPDRPVGRKRILTPSALKKFALAQKLTVFTPEKAGSKESLELVCSLNPDVILVCAYGQILPQSFLDIPKVGCFNLHFSFLPKLRGASPVQAAIASGFKTTGVSLQKMVLRLDAGPLVAASKPEIIHPNDTTLLLGSRLAETGKQLIRDTLPKLLAENFTSSEQNEEEASFCRIIKKEEGHVHWQEEAAVGIERKLRAFEPWPGIFSFYNLSGNSENKRRLQLTKVEVVNGDFESGKVYPELIVGTRTGGLQILRLKPEGKQEMDAVSFLRGNPQIVGTVLR
ncbi:MAG: methionyl-tRNA formyltransferase [SAR324 cluster bacterium]|nr:methionyl-tRNA formyltransferase [SAR324 cluster bacterium]MBL7034714.1 methionyl-tRNA formyltransferase [SAR324 cluster bacterium]